MTIYHEVVAILHFFEWNDVYLNTKKINRSIPQDEELVEDRAYTYLEIEQMLAKCDERGRVIILLMASTGIRIGALPRLRVGDLTIMPQEGNICKVLKYFA